MIVILRVSHVKEGKMLRAAASQCPTWKEIEQALTEQLMGHASFVYLAQPELGRSLINTFQDTL